jgi:hypothetical protein
LFLLIIYKYFKININNLKKDATMSISYTVNDKQIHLSTLPIFTKTTADILKKTNAVALSSVLNSYNYELTQELSGRTESIETVRAALENSRDHKTREMVFSLLETAFYCSMIAGIVLLAVFGGELAPLFAVGIVAYMFIAGGLNFKLHIEKIAQFNQRLPWLTHHEINANGYAIAGCSFFALFTPLYDVLTRQKRIEQVRNEQDSEMDRDLRIFLAFAEELSRNLTTIRSQLTEKHTALSTEKENYTNKIQSQNQQATQQVLNQAAQAAVFKLEDELRNIETTQEALATFETFNHSLNIR